MTGEGAKLGPTTGVLG